MVYPELHLVETLPLPPFFVVKMQKIVICVDKDRFETQTNAQLYLQTHCTFLSIYSDRPENGNDLFQ